MPRRSVIRVLVLACALALLPQLGAAQLLPLRRAQRPEQRRAAGAGARQLLHRGVERLQARGGLCGRQGA
ncbi:MAG: hypothetical protein NZ555_15350, partial [Geminicoccaceae bacterium]|nr:hypothetical protein [Geminicoccaceae bacterium]